MAFNISCGFSRKKALFLSGDEMGARGLKRESDARIEAGIDVRLLNATTLRSEFGINRPAALVSDISASANPGQMASGLLRHAAKAGVEITSNIEITDVTTAGGEVILATSNGRIVSAGHAVFCTGYEFLKSLESPRHRIVSTWAMASAPHIDLPRWLQNHIVWEAAEPYLYFRSTRDGRLIAGGEDEDNPEGYQSAPRLKEKTARIRRKIEKLLGCDIGNPEYKWAAAFGTTTTGLPLIGCVPGLPNVHAVMGFGGNGITFSQIAAEIVSEAINGIVDPDADLYR